MKNIFRMSDDLFDALKWVAQIGLPALGTAYFGLARIWGFPYGEEIVGTVTVIDTLLGAWLGLSSKYYYDDLEKEYEAGE